MRFIVPIVEGPGDVAAAPELLRRVLYECLDRYDIGVTKPKNANGKGRLIKRLENFIGYAALTDGCVAIFVLLDADDDCPKELSIELAGRARAAGLGIPTVVVCANREYESWFLASDEDFQGDAEGYSGAKQWLNRRVSPGLAYKETRDQVRFSATMDIDAAFESSRSFRRLCSAVNELIQFIDTGVIKATPGA